ncbi:MAG: TIGR03085 family protein [Pseudonocardiales bacterium]|nr:TIGR03085 family protein [Pseudonocardiales bacterium]MBV9029519.1 TIGR03085 family protein [Pseudonocardiales bacterium]
MTVGEQTLAAGERHELCDLMERLGPDAPTLCEGWTTRDLAAHLVIRESRPVAAAGILIPLLAGLAARAQRDTAERPWPELVELVRNGPPWWSLIGRGPISEKVNGVEFFVHHEDVRRVGRGWERRAADPRRAEALWAVLSRLARLCYRRSPVGVVLRRPDGTERVARRGRRSVTVIGPPEELTLHAYGRAEAMVDLEGDQTDVQRLQDSPRGF